MGTVIIKKIIRRIKSGDFISDKGPSKAELKMLTDEKKIEKEREAKRREGRRKKAIRGIIFKEGTFSGESETNHYEIFIKVKEGKINKKILSKINDIYWNHFNIVKITPKTKEVFIEIHKTGTYGKFIQSFYLMKNKNKILKINL